jgi:outer membrane usher protein
MNSAFVFARNDEGEWGAGMSRPVPSSFAIFKPEDKLKGQKIALKSIAPYVESQTGLFGEITYSQLLAYQYREIQLDPTYLDEGRSLKKEKFVLFPTYKSAHLITLEDQGMVMLKGTLTKTDGSPWPLQVGHLGDKTFFTNRDGVFFIEGVEPGSYVISLEGNTSKIKIDVPEDAQGIKELGNMILEEDE